ncbi:MAG TPA: hypothetical protein VMX94_12680 [Armatimonadota bacterium]|nr:hypothetical protein [Armatimonadota bacterium]
MKRSTRAILITILLALIPTIVKLQVMIDPGRRQFQPGRGVGSVMTKVGTPIILPSQFVVGTVIGLREVVAGLLWVRVNDFFHSGNYEAIVPLTRMITWLDPHQIDVYSTGAWHLAYNFVDSDQRADRRYLAPAIKFLREGVDNNPTAWDPKFDLGFVLYNLKAQDFPSGRYWISRAWRENGAPDHVHRQIAHTYEKEGRIEDCIKEWKSCIRESEAVLKKNPKDGDALNHLTISKQNLDLILMRQVLREDVGKHPRDVDFEATFKQLRPRVFVLSGRANLPDYARIDVTLLDEDYKEPSPKDFSWEVDPNVTALVQLGMHGMLVENGKFQSEYDLSKDAKQYPFKKDRYVLTLTFNPRTASHQLVQNATGWNGEGITDKKYLDTSIPGLRSIRKVIRLKREDIM